MQLVGLAVILKSYFSLFLEIPPQFKLTPVPYYTEADIKALAADTGTSALVLVLLLDALGDFDGAGGFRKAKGMRHVWQLNEPRYLPAENFTSIITVVHAHDVEFGDLGYMARYIQATWVLEAGVRGSHVKTY